MWKNGNYRSIRWAFNFKEWKPVREDWEFATKCVQSEENDRIHKFVYAEDAKASMAVQLMIRKAAYENLGIPYDQIDISRTESGKPYICSNQDAVCEKNYHFNASHHGDLCILAAENGCGVGVDVMKMEYKAAKPVPEYFKLMRKLFTHSEWDYIMCPHLEEEQIQRFYRLWCLKESYVKAIGTGITYDLRNLSFHCPTVKLKKFSVVDDTVLYVKGEIEACWHFEETILNENHCAVVAIEKKKYDNNHEKDKNHPRFSYLMFNDLIQNAVPFSSPCSDLWLSFCKKNKKPF